jgi:hypothetical protein
MYYAPLNCLMIALMLCSLCLQGCRSSLRVTSEEPMLKKLRKTSDDTPATSQTLAPYVQTSASPDVHMMLPTAASTTPPSVATSTVQVASPVHYPAVNPDALSPWKRAWSTKFEDTDEKPASSPTAQVAGFSSAGCLASLRKLLFSVSTPIFGAREWTQYFGEVGEDPPLPSDIDEILGSPCPFWPDRAVRDTHLLVLIPSTVDGKAFTLDLLGELIRNPRGGGHSAQYFLYDDEVQQLSGDAYSSSSYWVLMTRDVLPGSRSKSYAVQQDLVAQQSSYINYPPYEIPYVLEAATAILSHYVCGGDRLYAGYAGEGIGDELPSTSTRCAELLEDVAGNRSPVTVGRFCERGLVFLSGFNDDAESGISCLRKFGARNYRSSALLHSFGAEEWGQYFGEVEEAPPLPEHVVATLNGPCPFWSGKAVRDTHLLCLIPATVAGDPFSLNLLGELIRQPSGGGLPIKYRFYDSDVQAVFGAQSPTRSYWVLMTRDVLEGSKSKKQEAQNALVAAYARETSLPYVLPSALEAATVILLHYVRSGERLYTDAPCIYTRCQELVNDQYPVVVGGFSSGGLFVNSFDDFGSSYIYGVASLRRF